MNHLVAACRSALESRNWYAALVVALTLPDVCGRIQHPATTAGSRYQAWWDANLTPTQVVVDLPNFDLITLIDGAQAWRLRCKVLHESSDVLQAKPLQRFKLVYPSETGAWGHALSSHDGPLLDVAQLCEDICGAAEQWVVRTAASDDRMMTELSELLVIDSII